MSHLQKVVVACVLTSLCSIAPAQKAKVKKTLPIDYSLALKVPIADLLKSDFKTLFQLRRALLVPLTNPGCTYQSGGVCAIEVPVFLMKHPTENTMYCGAAFPEVVKLPDSGDKSTGEKTIVWTLKPVALNQGDPMPAPNEITFYPEKDHGIILLKNGDKQMHGGTLGDGTKVPPEATSYLFKNKHRAKTAEAVYLPIVVRTENAGTSTEKISVCGTPDPKMVND